MVEEITQRSRLNTNMKDWRSGLEKSIEDLHGTVLDWDINDDIDICLSGGECYKSSLWTGLTSKRAWIWTKFDPKIKYNLRILCVNLRLIRFVGYFSYFCQFWHFECVFCKIRLFSVSRKVHDHNPHIFSFDSVYIL